MSVITPGSALFVLSERFLFTSLSGVSNLGHNTFSRYVAVSLFVYRCMSVRACVRMFAMTSSALWALFNMQKKKKKKKNGSRSSDCEWPTLNTLIIIECLVSICQLCFVSGWLFFLFPLLSNSLSQTGKLLLHKQCLRHTPFFFSLYHERVLLLLFCFVFQNHKKQYFN